MSRSDPNESLRILQLEAQLAHMRREMSHEERNEIARVQSRADAVARFYGTSASQHVPGESVLAYRRRCLAPFLSKSEGFKNTSPKALDLLDAATLTAIEETVYKDAADVRTISANATPGTLVPVTEMVGGRPVTRYYGDCMAWMAPFMTDAQHVVFNDPGKK